MPRVARADKVTLCVALAAFCVTCGARQEKHEKSTRVNAVAASSLPSILVTGGCGNIGSVLVRDLEARHRRVTVVDIRSCPSECSSRTACYKQDVVNATALQHVARRESVTGIIHLAAVARVQWCLDDPSYCALVNVDGTRAVVDAVNTAPSVRWLIFASSREVYGASPAFPVDETSSRAPLNIYGTTKSDAESVLETSVRKPAIVLRLSNVYGGLNDHGERLIPSLLTKALLGQTMVVSGGDQVMDFSHIRDVVRAFLLAVERAETQGPDLTYETYNIVSGQATRVSDLVQHVRDVAATVSPVTNLPYDARFPSRYEARTELARTRLGFQARLANVTQGLVLFRNDLLRLWTKELKNAMKNDCAGDDGTATWMSADELPAIHSCKFEAVIAGAYGIVQGRLGPGYRVDVADSANDDWLAGADLCYSSLDGGMYFVAGQDRQLIARAGLSSCDFTSDGVANMITPTDLLSGLDTRVELLRAARYNVDITRAPWAVQCSSLRRAWGHHVAQLRKGSRTSNGTPSSFTANPSAWPRFNAPHCMLDCRLPQVCVYDGRCVCPPTAVACPFVDAQSKRIALRKGDGSLHALAKSLKPANVLLESVVPLWSAAKHGVDVRVVADGEGVGDEVGRLLAALGRPTHPRATPTVHPTVTVGTSAHGTCSPEPRRVGHVVADATKDGTYANGTIAVSLTGSYGQPCMNLHVAVVVPNVGAGETRRPRARVRSVLQRTHLLQCDPTAKACSLLKRQRHDILGSSDDFSTAQFCLVTRDNVDLVNRMAILLSAGCIPIFAVDDTLLPHENVLDFRKFSVRAHERDVGSGHLINVLAAMREDDKVYLQAHVLRVANAFAANQRATDLNESDGINLARLVATDLMRVVNTIFPEW